MQNIIFSYKHKFLNCFLNLNNILPLFKNDMRAKNNDMC